MDARQSGLSPGPFRPFDHAVDAIDHKLDDSRLIGAREGLGSIIFVGSADTMSGADVADIDQIVVILGDADAKPDLV